MKRGKVISILRFFSTIDKEIQMNNATVEDLNDRYYSALGAVNMDGLPLVPALFSCNLLSDVIGDIRHHVFNRL